jgi:hypothetical protein
MTGCHTDTRKPEKVQTMASVKNSLLTYFSGSLGNFAGDYVGPLQSVLISIIMLTGLLSRIFFGFSPSNHRGEYNDIILLMP